ncbi:MAG: sterol desaturase family protein [Halioglobus sp.]|nr:sterol desaturase family protein [Halioglobus sp.]
MVRKSFLNGMARISVFLGVMSILGVAAFHFPEYLTTPALREHYQQYQVRTLLYTGMVLASILAPIALFFSEKKLHALLGLCCVMLAWLAGGADVSYGDQVRDARFYISLDWVLLDLTIIATLFINIEMFFRLKKDQGVLRPGWQVDLTHYVANHIFNGAIVFLLFLPAQWLAAQISLGELRHTVSGLPLFVQVPLIMLVTDIAQYWVHRAFHRVPLLWRFHRIHHSVEQMDWLAGSRLHIVDVLLTRSISLMPMVVLGFSNEAINFYLPILALQSVFIHCNLEFEFRWLDKILTTPHYHHWHHTRDENCIDRNFAISLPLLDLLFGTYYCPKGKWPREYGLVGKSIKGGYLAHLMAPFRKDSV